MIDMTKLLILGSNGFIGRSLKEFFLKIKKFKLLTPTKDELNLENQILTIDYLKLKKPDIILHAASTFKVNDHSVERNVKLFFNVLAGRNYYGKLIYFGSGAEYNKDFYVPLMKENFFRNYSDKTYELSKYICGKEIENCNYKNIFNLRLFSIYGSYEEYLLRPIANNICRVFSGLPILINRDINIDYLFIDDFCELLLKFIEKKSYNFKTYNLCSGKPVRLTKLMNILKKEMNVKTDLMVQKAGEKKEYSGDPSRFFNEVGKIKFTPYKEAIKKMIFFFEKQFSNSDKYRIF